MFLVFVSIILIKPTFKHHKATLDFAWEITDRPKATAHLKLSTVLLSQNLKHVCKNSYFLWCKNAVLPTRYRISHLQ